MNRLALLTALVVLTACASGARGSAPGGRADGAFDREAERRAVYEAVLRHASHRDVQRYVLEPGAQGGLGYGGGPGGNLPSKARRDTIADLRRRPTRPMPRDLAVGVPVEFLSAAEWDALPVAGDGFVIDERWKTFRARFPGSAGWMIFTNVGFSADGRQALVHLVQSHASLAGRGHFVLLEHSAAGWRVVEESTTVVS